MPPRSLASSTKPPTSVHPQIPLGAQKMSAKFGVRIWGQKMRSTVGAKKWGQQMRPKVDVKSCGHLLDLG